MYKLSGYGKYFSPVYKDKSPLRVLSTYEIELMSAANGIGFRDGQEFPYQKDHIYVFRPRQTRQSHGSFQAYYLHFSCADPLITQYLDNLPGDVTAGDMRPFYGLFRDILTAMAHKAPGFELIVNARITELIALLYNVSSVSAPADSRYALYTSCAYDAAHFMQKHLAEHITLNEIAASAHLSPSFFHTVFKNILGVTPHRYLLDLRINTAKSLLTNSDKPLAVVAQESGFDSQVYLNYILKKELGVTPRQYRAAHQNKNYR